MPSPRRRLFQTKPNARTKYRAAWIVCAVVLVASPLVLQNSTTTTAQSQWLLFQESRILDDVPGWRAQAEESCRKLIEGRDPAIKLSSKTMLDRKESLEREVMAGLQISNSDAEHPKYIPCKHAFIDLGSNIGDSVGYFFDAAVDVCTPLWAEANKPDVTALGPEFPRPHLDLKTNTIMHRGHQASSLYGWLQKYAKEEGMHLDETCVYGMEGNPLFTDRLKKLENLIMHTNPRPVKHVHIHTESVVMAEDGPTQLYIDQSLVQCNFCGSSVLSSARDVVDTANKKGGKPVIHDVEGVSLTSLVKNTMMPFQEGQRDKDMSGGILLIKMDIEGAEYQVIKEIADSNVLCDYIGANRENKVIMIVEWHNSSINDKKQLSAERRGTAEATQKLKNCGVVFDTLDVVESLTRVY